MRLYFKNLKLSSYNLFDKAFFLVSYVNMKPFIYILFLFSCSVTSIPSKKEKLGLNTKLDIESIKKTKPIVKFTKIKVGDWAVRRAGLIDLNDKISKEKKIEDGIEPIGIYLFLIEHPTKGSFIIDTGISEIFRTPEKIPVSWLVNSALNLDKLKIHYTTKDYLDKNKINLSGAFLTHIHLDHIMGSLDISKEIPFYVGPNETKTKSFQNFFINSSNDRLLGEDKKLIELEFDSFDKEADFPAIDFFGDKSLIIFHSKGHTAGSLVFLVNSNTGPNLILGDTCHTKFGWENNVPPGKFTEDIQENKKALNHFKILSTKIPNLKVHPGHQEL